MSEPPQRYTLTPGGFALWEEHMQSFYKRVPAWVEGKTEPPTPLADAVDRWAVEREVARFARRRRRVRQ